MRTSTGPHHPLLPTLRLAAILSLLLAGALLAIWLWSRYCRFPSVPWNDMRLAPTIALSQGWPVYPTATEGTINTWMYGPLSLFFFWPATWASSADGALLIAAALNIALTLVPLALVCFMWPAGDGSSDSKMGRASAFLLCLAVWPELHYSVIFSDNLAVACGLLGNLILIRARRPHEYWAAAFAATAAVACKQIALGIPLAQVVWLAMAGDRRIALRHFGRCLLSGAVLAAGAITFFGWRGLWFTLVEVPGGLGWAPDTVQRLMKVAPEMAFHLGLPAAVMLARWRAFAPPDRLLPALAWVCTLPLGIAGMMKVGGWTNSIHGFVLWLPPVLTSFLTFRWPEHWLRLAQLTAAAGAAALGASRILHAPDLQLRPQVAAYQEAAQLAAQHQRALWFPMYPLVTLYSDHRYYHDEDGMYVRMKAQKSTSPQHTVTHLPSAMQGIVFRNDWNDWGIARRMLPPNSREAVIGHWTMWSGVAEAAGP